MDFSRRRVRVLNAEEDELAELYPHDLQMYKAPPMCEISLTEFEQLAVERLKVLRLIEESSLSGNAKNSDEWKNGITDELKKHSELKSFYKVVTSSGVTSKEPDYQARKADHISHFVLRIAFCRTEELRRWFIAREVDLFRLRWLYLSAEGKTEFIRINNLNYTPISESELAEVSEKSCGMVGSAADYYRVVFTRVPALVSARRVFLYRGFAYITTTDIIHVMLTLYRTNLSHELSRTVRLLPTLESVEEDRERILRPLKALPHAHVGEDYSNKKPGGRVPVECIDSLARQSFPLCMRQLHAKLRQEHKLKHHGRLQYCLFLKGIGVTLEDVLTMWREEWAKVEPEKFEKGGIAYLVRHSYGKEGKRTNYTPQSCMKIIMSGVGPGDQHGCPFKHSDAAAVRLILTQANTTPADIQETMDLITRGQFSLACTKYFQLAHGTAPERIINHPNQYFEESQNVKSGKSTEVKKEFSGTKVTSTSTKKSLATEELWKGEMGDEELMDIDFN